MSLTYAETMSGAKNWFIIFSCKAHIKNPTTQSPTSDTYAPSLGLFSFRLLTLKKWIKKIEISQVNPKCILSSVCIYNRAAQIWIIYLNILCFFFIFQVLLSPSLQKSIQHVLCEFLPLFCSFFLCFERPEVKFYSFIRRAARTWHYKQLNNLLFIWAMRMFRTACPLKTLKDHHMI